ncbi:MULTISPECIES: DNA primase [Bacillus]|uniref:DNA primase n=1 Tax=Bacillus TaxID=1386 RepID=UPI0002FCFDFC|nr:MULTISPECIES: DNA primase [Bacillus]
MSNSRLSEEQLNTIRNAVDIVDVINEYVQLKKQGRNYFGLCPFHGENTPSFSVSPDKQIFHCFGCGAGGNVFTFLMDIEGYSFLEAAKELAERGNVPLQIELSDNNGQSQPPSAEKKMIEAHELLTKFYHHLLLNTKEGEEALQYLLDRGFTKESIEKFSIGYALNSWDFVHTFLSKRGFDDDVLYQAGIIVKREDDQKKFDRFRNRIMFPIKNHHGEVVAFSGRALGNDEPKYLNSPETPIFNKSKVLFNFHQARASIRKKEQAVLFEGFADTISANAAGVENGIATMGTSLTDDHLQILKRNCSQILICYDSDNPGLEAANRAADMILQAGLSVKVALMPDGLDPDEYIKKYGTKSFSQDVIGNSYTYLAFKMRFLKKGRNMNNEGDRISYIEEVLKEIAKLPNAVEREHYLRQISSEFSLSLDTLMAQQKQVFFAEKKRGNLPQNNFREPSSGIVLQYEQKLKPAYINAELRLIAHMLQDKETAFKIRSLLGDTLLNIDEHQAIITYLYGYYEEREDPDISLFLSFIPDKSLRQIVSQIQMMSVSPDPSEDELKDYVSAVLKQQKMLKIKEKEAERMEAERLGDYLQAAKIASEILRLKTN